MLKVQKDHKVPKVIREVHHKEPKVPKEQVEDKVPKEQVEDKVLKEPKRDQVLKVLKELNLQVNKAPKVHKVLFGVLDQQVLKEEQDLTTLDHKVLKDQEEVQDHKVLKEQQGRQDLQMLD